MSLQLSPLAMRIDHRRSSSKEKEEWMMMMMMLDGRGGQGQGHCIDG